MTINYPLQIAYLASSVLFILGLKALSSPASARRGMFYAEIGMAMAVIGTLVGHHIITWEWIIVGSLVGSVVGAAMAIYMPMTAMPQRIALSHSFGAMAAVLVGIAEFHKLLARGGPSHGMMSALGFEILFGSLTITGSLMAFGKLQGLITGTPITYQFQNVTNIAMFFATVAIFVYLIFDPQGTWLFYLMLLAGLVIGVLIVMPIGGADMPVVVSLLNSYAGLASAATGFRHQQQGAHHRGGPGRGLGLLPLDPHEPGDEPLLRQRALRRRGQRQRRNGRPGRGQDRHPLHPRGRRADAPRRPLGDPRAGLRHGRGPGAARRARTEPSSFPSRG